MSENSKWRCPYCDGLNDWHNEVCEVCGDGRRPEAKSPEKAVEVPKTYTPQPRPEAPKAPEREPSKTADTPTAPAPEPPVPEPPKKKKKGGLLVTAVIIALAAVCGKYVGQEMSKSFIKPQSTAIPVPVTAPRTTIAPLPKATIIPAPTRVAATTRAPALPAPKAESVWNFKKASDAEIRDAMSLFFQGTDQNEVDCALFMDPTGTHGGYMYSENRRVYTYDMGSFVDEGSDTQFKLINPDGETTVISAKPLQGKENAIQILSIGNQKFSGLVLQQSDTMKSMYSSMMLRAAHGETAATQPPAHDDFRLAVGSKGEEVKRLQKALIKLGFLTSSADGIFGPKTEQAVKQAQASHHYKQTGVVDYEQYRDFTISAGILSGADFK